jgi:methionyl aminopeptidase
VGQFQQFSEAELSSLRRGGKILQDCLKTVAAAVRPGITTGELDQIAERFILERGGRPAFKGYHGFPATLCISVNEQCVHGIPGDRELLEGDIVSLDGGVILDDLYTDACVTVGVGQISAEAKNLIETGEEALKIAVKTAKAGVRIGDISAAVQQYVEGRGFTIVRALTGHGLGSTLHQFPDVPNFGKAGTGPVLPVGALIAVEPIVSAGGANIREESDGWTICTVDDSLATHSEHTILITERGAEIIA